MPASNVARWDGNGWSSLGSGMDQSDAALAISPAGEIYVGGYSKYAGTKPSNGIGRFYTPAISVDDVTVAEGNAGTTPATFTLRLTAASPLTFTVDVATSNGSAAAPADYGAFALRVTVPFLATSVPIPINVVGDTAAEPDETFVLNLTAASAGVIVDGQAIGTITNDDISTATPTAPPGSTPTPAGVTPRAFLPLLRR